MDLSITAGLQGFVNPVQTIDGLVNLVFYQEINNFLRGEIGEFQTNLVGRMMGIFGAAALVMLTVWIALQGFRIITGRSRESLMALVVDALRATLIIALATGLAVGNKDAYRIMTEGLGDTIVSAVTKGGEASDLYSDIDKSLGLMALALGSVEAVQVQEQPGDATAAQATKTRNLYFAGFGTGGPAITAGVMLTLNKIAIALFVGLGPLFIMCLLFDQTKPLFQRWLLYGIGTWFSLAVLYVMVILAMDLTISVASAFWAGKMLELAGQQGINSMAVQQAGLGVILTMLLITAPGMAAAFFQGTLGQFMHYSVFDQNSRNVPSASGGAGSGTASARGAQQVTENKPLQDSSLRNLNSQNAGLSPHVTGARGLAGPA